MSIYSADLTSINANIVSRLMTTDQVRVVTNITPVNIDILKRFPNIEHIYPIIAADSSELETIGQLLSELRYLKTVNLSIMVLGERLGNKRSRADFFESVCSTKLVKLLDQIGSSLRYMNFFINIVNESRIFTFGCYYGKISVSASNDVERDTTERIFSHLIKTLQENDCITAISTHGVYSFDTALITSLISVDLFADSTTTNLDKEFLSELLKKCDRLSLMYNHFTYRNYDHYTRLILDKSVTKLTSCQAIIRLSDLNRLLSNNPDLKDVWVHLSYENEVDILNALMTKYADRQISFVVFHNRVSKKKYWKKVSVKHDVVFRDLIVYLNR